MKFIFILSCFLLSVDCHRILLVFPISGKSHAILGGAFVDHLLKAGHEVTYILPFKMAQRANLTQIVIDNTKYFSDEVINVNKLMNKEMDMSDARAVHGMMYKIAENTMQQESVLQLMRDPAQKFDLVIVEWLFVDFYAVLSALYNCPFIWVSSVEPHWQVMRLMGETMNPAYNVHVLGDQVPPYSFWNRIKELCIQLIVYRSVRQFNALENDMYQKKVVPLIKQRGLAVPEYEDVIYNASLMFGNSHYSLGLAPSLPQSYIPIAGYHINPTPAPLNGDMKKLLDGAKHGLIYFSLGSTLRSKDIPDDLKQKLVTMFSKLQQIVLWKFEEILPGLPKNVHITSWAPQQSILAHPNTVLFITHGGLLSTTEAVHYGKPIIGIPVFADQFANVEKAVHKGFARHVSLSMKMDADLQIEIDEILKHPRYAENAKKWSLIYHDRPVSPAKAIPFWVDHVIKTRGAFHLRSPALLVPWYQRFYLDLITTIITLNVIFYLVVKKLLCRKEAGPKKKKIA